MYDRLIKYNSFKENVNKCRVDNSSDFHVHELDLEAEKTNENVDSKYFYAFNSTPNVISQNLINSINNMFSPNQDESSLDETMYNSPGRYFNQYKLKCSLALFFFFYDI